MGEGWTLATIKTLADPNYYLLIWRTFWLSGVTTIICLVLALPVGYQLSVTSESLRRFLLLMIVVPFWSSFLIRIFSWKTLLHPEGLFKRFIVTQHLYQCRHIPSI